MALGRIKLSVAEARDLAEGALRSLGFDDNEARIVADHVVDADLQSRDVVLHVVSP